MNFSGSLLGKLLFICKIASSISWFISNFIKVKYIFGLFWNNLSNVLSSKLSVLSLFSCIFQRNFFLNELYVIIFLIISYLLFNLLLLCILFLFLLQILFDESYLNLFLIFCLKTILKTLKHFWIFKLYFYKIFCFNSFKYLYIWRRYFFWFLDIKFFEK